MFFGRSTEKLLSEGQENAKIKNKKSKLWSCRKAATTSLILHFDI